MKLRYPDTVILVDPVIGNSGEEKIGRQETVKCIFGSSTGFGHSANEDLINSDAIAYLDHEDDYVVSENNRLEGMLLIADQGEGASDAWYRIIQVNVGKRSLLDNALDNVQVNLKKTGAIGYVS